MKNELSQHDLELIEKLIKLPDSEIDLKDSPEVTGRFSPERAGFQSLFRPLKQQITLRLDGDVIAWARRDGDGYQSRLNAILRKAMMDELKASRR